MEYNSKPDRIQSKKRGTAVSKEKQDSIEAMVKDGKSIDFIAEKQKVSPLAVERAITDIQDSKGLDVAAWKREISQNLAGTANKLARRLDENIDSLPIGQVALSLAIIVDKVQQLQDAPTVIVEHRLRVSHEDINAMLKGEVVEVKEVKQSDLTK